MTATRTVTVHDLRDRGERILDDVMRGSTFTVTCDGARIAELRPIQRKSPVAAELIARRRTLPEIDPDALRRDIDMVLAMTP